MAATSSNPALRLTGDAPAWMLDVAPTQERSVESANRAAAALGPDDARLIFAAGVADSLEGGRAAVLTADTRERLMRRAARLGLRTFDANLIIAIVQDDARRGGAGLTGDAAGLLGMVGGPTVRRPLLAHAAGLLIAAAAFGGAGLSLLIAWVLR